MAKYLSSKWCKLWNLFWNRNWTKLLDQRKRRESNFYKFKKTQANFADNLFIYVRQIVEVFC